MPRKSRLKSRRNRRRGVINDQNQNDTNIRVRYRKAYTFAFLANQCSVPVRPGMSALSDDLAQIYKQYRITHLRLTFQAAGNDTTLTSPPAYAINYIPALESNPGATPVIDDYEGAAVGFWQDQRGTPYHYTVPSNVLNAMPLNWYETVGGSAADLVQGYLHLTSTATAPRITALMDITFEFQTLEATDFLAHIRREYTDKTHRALVSALNTRNKVQPWVDVSSPGMTNTTQETDDRKSVCSTRHRNY